MKNIFVINGKPGSGKDTFVELCQKYCNDLDVSKLNKNTDTLESIKVKVYNISSIDIVKEIATKLGWNGVKDPISRNMLADLKKFLNKYFQTVDKYIDDKINEIPEDENSIIFIHIREPEEIQKIKDRYPNNCNTLFIDRDIQLDNDITNSSDLEVENYKYDQIINNNGTIEDLEAKVDEFFIDILLFND